MKTKNIWGLAGTGMVFFLAVGLVWQTGLIDRHFVSASTGSPAGGEAPGIKEEAKTVGVVRPRPIENGSAIVLPGRARAATQATLFFRVDGPLEKVHANPGDRVKKGDLLLEMDDRDYLRQVRVVESQLKSARANLLKMKTGARPEDIRIVESSLAAAVADLDLAKKELERHEILYKNQAVSEQAYDRAKTNVQSLGASVASLEEQLARDKKGARKEDIMTARASIEELTVRLAIAKDQLGDTKLFAPFDGVVTKRIPDAHEMVGKGEPVMMLDDISRLEIPVDVPENHVRRVLAPEGGKTSAPSPAEDRYTALFLTTGNRQYPAVLSEYSSRADQATGTYEFVFSITPAPGDLLFPGMTAEIRISSPRAASRPLAIPLQSLMGVAGNSAHVFRVDPSTGKAVRQAVTFEDLSSGNEVSVLTGLSGDDLVVDQGAAFIRQGEVVQFDLP
ncbi:MAG: efflux RND transporter periplasmic adaptor subunit [Desulfobacterales bacterium]|nr:efflux RND transporter periplasmic adaptor subunit [Desulfobacterales bacterium]